MPTKISWEKIVTIKLVFKKKTMVNNQAKHASILIQDKPRLVQRPQRHALNTYDFILNSHFMSTKIG